MKPSPPFGLFLRLLVLLPWLCSFLLAESERLYVRILTRDGRTLEGPVRWTRNEASWWDLLDANKEISESNYEAARKLGEIDDEPREIRFLGLKILDLRAEDSPGHVKSGIRFGNIRKIEPLSSRDARVTLLSGQEIKLSGSTDLGRGMDELIVEDPEKGAVELEWYDIEVIEFLPDKSAPSTFGDRLYGTVMTRQGDGFTGYISWDVDETFSEDVLDGEDREGQDHDLKFGEILSIERYSSSSSLITLQSGEAVRLSGTNDVDSGNRDIMIADPNLGQVRVPWEDFERAVFEELPSEQQKFEPSLRLRGTVESESGQIVAGYIRWDNDEEYGWELLDGKSGGTEFQIEFSRVTSIEKYNVSSVIVTIRDGRSFRLSGSNDVNSGNKGIFVETENGAEVLVRWTDFRKVEFEQQ